MTAQGLAQELAQNKSILIALLDSFPKDRLSWSTPEGWSPTIIISHLLDEEREDFRKRLKMTYKDPLNTWPAIDPEAWVNERRYKDQDFHIQLDAWIKERDASIVWLKTIDKWDGGKAYQHAYFGEFTLQRIACNWIAHDLLHIKQLTRLKYDFLSQRDEKKLDYAGTWT